MSASKRPVRKLGAVIRKGPATVRNVVYSWLGIWPVSSIQGSDLHGVPTYCISLARATGKRDLIRKQVAGLEMKHFEFIDAVDARTLDGSILRRDKRLDDDGSIKHHGRALSMNEVACSLSHGLAYELIRLRRHPVALIVEDDALFIARRMRNFSFADVPDDFDCVFLNSFNLREPPDDHRRGLVFGDASYGGSSAAYLVSASGVEKLASSYLPVVHAADGLLGRNLGRCVSGAGSFRQQGARMVLNAYLCYPDCVLNGSASHYHVSDVTPAQSLARRQRTGP